MAGFDPRQYDQQASRFGPGSATERGTFAKYLGGQGSFGNFAGQMQDTMKPVAGTNEQQQRALANRTESTNLDQWGQGLGRITQQQGQYAQLGSSALSSIQAWSNAKDMAKLQSQANTQSNIFGGISTGLGLLGSFGGFGGGGGGSGASYSLPSSSGWSLGSNMFG